MLIGRSLIWRQCQSVQKLWQTKQATLFRVCGVKPFSFSSFNSRGWDEETWLVKSPNEDGELFLFNTLHRQWVVKNIWQDDKNAGHHWRVRAVDGNRGMLLMENADHGGLQVLNPFTMQSFHLPDAIYNPDGDEDDSSSEGEQHEVEKEAEKEEEKEEGIFEFHTEWKMPWKGSLFTRMKEFWFIDTFEMGLRYDSKSNTYKVIVLDLGLLRNHYFMAYEYDSARRSWKIKLEEDYRGVWDWQIIYTFMCNNTDFYCFDYSGKSMLIYNLEISHPFAEKCSGLPNFDNEFGEIVGYKDERIMNVCFNLHSKGLTVYEYEPGHWKAIYNVAGKDDDEDFGKFVDACFDNTHELTFRGGNAIWIANGKTDTVMCIDVEAGEYKFFSDSLLREALKTAKFATSNSLGIPL